ncbi:MAG: ComEC/Rec2 family competence protein [Roseburia sp.]
MKKKKTKLISFLLMLGMLGLVSACGGTVEEPFDTEQAVENHVLATGTADDDAEAGQLAVHFIDVGQGDCTLIGCDGQYMLIDAGNNDKGTAVWSYLQNQGVETLDYVIGTHPDADHIGGLDVVLYKFDCKTVILPDVANDTATYDDVIRTMEDKGYTTTAPVVGDTYSLGSAEFTIVAPNEDYGTELNDWSVAILLQHGENRFLFTGDAGEAAEEDMLANGISLSADVYQVGHHGSKYSTSQAFLDAVNPAYAVISVGADNSYGHPDAEVLNRLRSAGISLFRTDEQGTVIAESDGNTITWNCTPTETWQAGEAGSAAAEEQQESVTEEASEDTLAESVSESVAGEEPADTSQENQESDALQDSQTADAASDAMQDNQSATPASDALQDDQTSDVSQDVQTEDAAGDVSQDVQAEDVTVDASQEAPASSDSGIIVHITATGEKYHSAGCQYLRKSDYEVTLEEAKNRGLTPCSKCNPPQ